MRYRYACKLRPPMLGGVPKKGLLEVKEFDYSYVDDEVGTRIYGFAYYDRRLDDRELYAYDMVEKKEDKNETEEELKKLNNRLLMNYHRAEENYQKLKTENKFEDDDYPKDMAYADGYRQATWDQWREFDMLMRRIEVMKNA